MVTRLKWWHELPGTEAVPGLHATARETIERILEEIEEADLVPPILRYGRALDMELRAREEWEELGRPILLEYPNGMTGVHPLVKVMQGTAKHAAEMHKLAGLGINGAAYKRPQGRPVGAVSAPDRRNAPPRLKPLPGADKLPPKLSVIGSNPEAGA